MYYFWIDYDQDKANNITNALSQYFLQSDKEKVILQAKNDKILDRLQ